MIPHNSSSITQIGPECRAVSWNQQTFRVRNKIELLKIFPQEFDVLSQERQLVNCEFEYPCPVPYNWVQTTMYIQQQEMLLVHCILATH